MNYMKCTSTLKQFKNMSCEAKEIYAMLLLIEIKCIYLVKSGYCDVIRD